MSEFNPFGPAEEAPAFTVEETEDKSSRSKVVLLGALAAVVLGAGGFFLLGGSGDEELEDFTPIARAPQTAATPDAAAPVAKLPAASTVALGRNPFRALYVQPVAAPAVAPAPAAPAPVGPAPAQPGTDGAPAPAPAAVSTVKMTGVNDGTASFVYDGKELSGKQGDVMDGKLLVVSIAKSSSGTWYAYLQLGDGAKFEVHEGQTVVVQ
jgi:hypothetical protein